MELSAMTIVGDARGEKMKYSPARSLQGWNVRNIFTVLPKKETYLSHRKSKYLIK